MPSPDKNSFDLDSLATVHCLQPAVPMQLLVPARKYLTTPSDWPLLSFVTCSLCISPTNALPKSNRTCTHKTQLHFSAAYFSCNQSVTALHVTPWLPCASSANIEIVLASRHQCLCLLPKRANFGGVFSFELWLKAVMCSLISVVTDRCSVCMGCDPVVDREVVTSLI